MEVLYGPESKEDVVLTFGNFDGIHQGHVRVFMEVKRIASELLLPTAVMTFLPHTAVFLRARKNFLLLDFEQKLRFIESCGIDYLYVVKFGDEFVKLSPEEFIANVLVQRCRAKYIVVGENCVFGHRRAGNLDLLKRYSRDYGYGVTVVPKLVLEGHVCSSSSIRAHLQSGDVKTANLLLGRRHVVSGEVMKGVGRGRLIGFPTLNLTMENAVLLRHGVYHARVDIDGTGGWLPGVVNIGVRPTFSDTEYPILEMYVFNFNRDIYGQKVSVEIIDFVRPEKKFKSTTELTRQIKEDVAHVRMRAGV